MPSPTETPSDQIKKKIKETGIKQVHLAKKLGISPQHLNKILAKKQEKSQYLPKIAEILGMEESLVEFDKIINIPILTEKFIKSLSDGLSSFEDLKHLTFKTWPSIISDEYYFFGYELTECINSQIIKDDLLIFSTLLPIDMAGKIGIAFIKNKKLIFIGKLKYNQKNLVIYNENDCFDFRKGDQLLGVAIYLERKIEKGLI
ncbi:hypothetical protein Lnau_3098 [Legionella nautarum]|uniref:HTH cro/C1-type domain-containing protein n=1 Tax=Legionella nautarum TaxID=45070 RepID=A0A0W0WIM2_9GAMM|nr:helix-turn-helix transcriptional regulator [Legionella nautarum]KTD32187.1 hypothetical protein Lnau_3098 [Legionella nautarum]